MFCSKRMGGAGSRARAILNPKRARLAAAASSGSVLLAVVCAGGASPAAAQSTQLAQGGVDNSLTWKGITLYGAIDINAVDETHGVRNDPSTPPGAEYLLSKSSNGNEFTIGPNGITNSFIGLKGIEPIGGGWSASFKLETGFDPLTGRLSDGVASIAAQNGVPLTSQTTAADSSRAGQPFNQAAYFGVSHPVWGSLYFGRQNSIMTDGVASYDPELQSYAFSIIGYSGVAGGGGDTEDYRLDNSIKYAGQWQFVNFGLMYQAPGSIGANDDAYGANVGIKAQGLSLDAYYMKKNDAVAAGSLTAAQLAGSAATATKAAVAPDPAGSISGTVSDNSAFAIMGRYATDKLRIYAAFESITYANPSTPVAAGVQDIGGYDMSVVNNTAYTHHRVLQISWVGARYTISPKLEIGAALYHYGQNSYSGNGCDNTSAASCSGQLYDISLSAIYHLTSRLDAYAGAMHTQVQGGLGSGYLHTNAADPAAGLRFRF